MVKNLFGDLALDLSIKNLIGKIGRFSFDNASQMRAVLPSNQNIVIASGTVTSVSSVSTVSTVSSAGLGDNGKNATSQYMTANSFYNSIGSNFTRS